MTQDYPYDFEIKAIHEWPASDYSGLLYYVCQLWSDYGRHEKDGNVYTLITGGWSGNEELISALQENENFFWAMCWEESRRGGYYKFEAKEIK